MARAPPGSVHAIDADMRRVTFDVISATLLPSADEAFALTFERFHSVAPSNPAAGTSSTPT